MKLTKIFAREVLDSRGNPTVEAEVTIDGFMGSGIAPSGASTGEKEAVELRDSTQKRYHGKGVLSAVGQINDEVAKVVTDRYFLYQSGHYLGRD